MELSEQAEKGTEEFGGLNHGQLYVKIRLYMVMSMYMVLMPWSSKAGKSAGKTNGHLQCGPADLGLCLI